MFLQFSHLPSKSLRPNVPVACPTSPAAARPAVDPGRPVACHGGGFNGQKPGNIIYTWGIVSCYVWLLTGVYIYRKPSTEESENSDIKIVVYKLLFCKLFESCPKMVYDGVYMHWSDGIASEHQRTQIPSFQVWRSKHYIKCAMAMPCSNACNVSDKEIKHLNQHAPWKGLLKPEQKNIYIPNTIYQKGGEAASGLWFFAQQSA